MPLPDGEVARRDDATEGDVLGAGINRAAASREGHTAVGRTSRSAGVLKGAGGGCTTEDDGRGAGTKGAVGARISQAAGSEGSVFNDHGTEERVVGAGEGEGAHAELGDAGCTVDAAATD